MSMTTAVTTKAGLAMGKPPAPIGSNLSQVDMRGWPAVPESSGYAWQRLQFRRLFPEGKAYELFLSMFTLVPTNALVFTIITSTPE